MAFITFSSFLTTSTRLLPPPSLSPPRLAVHRHPTRSTIPLPRTLPPRPAKRAFSLSPAAAMRIVPVPVRTDNYAYLVIDDQSKSAAVVDPFDPQRVIQTAKDQNVSISGTILITHHHYDHSGGNQSLISELIKAGSVSEKSIKVYGGSSQVPCLTDQVEDGTSFKLLEGSIDVRCLATPCHTQDSICYYLQDASGARAVFTGDTLFVAGCGRFFEGSAAEMDRALNTTLAGLPADTVTYVGHEYTRSNVAFAKSIEPTNPNLLKLSKACSSDNVITTGKYTIGDEKSFNPFMRLEEPQVIKSVGNLSSRHQIMNKLRELKNSFSG